MQIVGPCDLLETVAGGAVIVLGVMIMVAGAVHSRIALGVAMVIAGGGWIVFISLVSALVQNLAPDWARARILSVFLLIFQGGMAAGSALWGTLAARAGIETVFLLAGVSTVATAALGFVARFPNVPIDLSPWNHWRMPAIRRDAAPSLDQGPVLVTVEYRVPSPGAQRFLHAMEHTGWCGDAMVLLAGASFVISNARMSSWRYSRSHRGPSTFANTSALPVPMLHSSRKTVSTRRMSHSSGILIYVESERST